MTWLTDLPTWILWTPIAVLALWFVLWTGFNTIMTVKRWEDDDDAATEIFWPLDWPALIWGVLGTVADVAFNWSIAIAMFLEWPQEKLFTARLKRHSPKNDWRGDLARWWCRYANKFHRGHCFRRDYPKLFPKD